MTLMGLMGEKPAGDDAAALSAWLHEKVSLLWYPALREAGAAHATPDWAPGAHEAARHRANAKPPSQAPAPPSALSHPIPLLPPVPPPPPFFNKHALFNLKASVRETKRLKNIF